MLLAFQWLHMHRDPCFLLQLQRAFLNRLSRRLRLFQMDTQVSRIVGRTLYREQAGAVAALHDVIDSCQAAGLSLEHSRTRRVLQCVAAIERLWSELLKNFDYLQEESIVLMMRIGEQREGL